MHEEATVRASVLAYSQPCASPRRLCVGRDHRSHLRRRRAEAEHSAPTARRLLRRRATPRPNILLPGAWQAPPAPHPLVGTSAVAPPPLTAASAVVLDEASGAVLFDKARTNAALPPA